MINEILTAAGVLFAQGRFLRMPDETHAVYFDDIEATGGDGAGTPKIYTHSVTVEVYEPKPDPDTENALEAEFDARGLDWDKQDRLWVEGAQRYQTVYELSYTTKTK
jgi:hypothetical protein